LEKEKIVVSRSIASLRNKTEKHIKISKLIYYSRNECIFIFRIVTKQLENLHLKYFHLFLDLANLIGSFNNTRTVTTN